MERSGQSKHQLKAVVINIQHLVETLKALKRIRTRVAPEQALHQDHSTIGTVQSLNKWAHIYALNGTPVKHYTFKITEFIYANL